MAEIDFDIRMVIPLKSYRKIMAFAEICDEEISGFADLEFDKEEMVLKVGEVYLLKQEVTGGTTELNEEAIAKFTYQMIKAGKTQLPRLWWHSHVNMGAFFSGTDTATMDYLGNDSFTVALVVNKRQEMKATFILWRPIKIEVEDIPVTIDMGYDRIPQSLVKEVERKVKTRVYKHEKNDKKVDKKNSEGFRKWNMDKEGNGIKRLGDGGVVYDLDDYDENGIYTPKKKSLFTGNSRNLLRLPKDPEAALRRIDMFNLIKEWDSDVGDYIYLDSDSGLAWYDYWGVLERD